MAHSYVPSRSDEDLDAYLTRVHQMVLKLSSGDFLMVQHGEASFPIYFNSDEHGKTPAVVAKVKQNLANMNDTTRSLPEVIYNAGCKDRWNASIEKAADLAHRLQSKVLYRYGPLEVTIYPWHHCYTEALTIQVYKLAKAAGMTMERL